MGAKLHLTQSEDTEDPRCHIRLYLFLHKERLHQCRPVDLVCLEGPYSGPLWGAPKEDPFPKTVVTETVSNSSHWLLCPLGCGMFYDEGGLLGSPTPTHPFPGKIRLQYVKLVDTW